VLEGSGLALSRRCACSHLRYADWWEESSSHVLGLATDTAAQWVFKGGSVLFTYNS